MHATQLYNPLCMSLLCREPDKTLMHFDSNSVVCNDRRQWLRQLDAAERRSAQFESVQWCEQARYLILHVPLA